MSGSRALFCSPSVKKQKHDLYLFFVKRIIKELLDSVFRISRIIKVSVRFGWISLKFHPIIVYHSGV